VPKAVIAEDEALLRESLLEHLRLAWPELEIVAACDDGGTALEEIAEHRPDVAFLDIRMPGLTGLEVASALAEASPKTQVVFVTAFNQYAIDAFERGAVDYLLKPIEPERLAATVRRLKDRASGAIDAELLSTLSRQLAKVADPGRAPLAWITASMGKETRLILVDDVAYFQSDTRYTKVMTKEGEALIRTPLRELLDSLDAGVFKQVHRSTIVNMRAVASVTRDENGRGTLKLRNRPETLTVSLPYMPIFRHM
jgi:DNA-binding LytR/AlgR family response regulator